jgi:hypothetical protein
VVSNHEANSKDFCFTSDPNGGDGIIYNVGRLRAGYCICIQLCSTSHGPLSLRLAIELNYRVEYKIIYYGERDWDGRLLTYVALNQRGESVILYARLDLSVDARAPEKVPSACCG